MTGETLFTSIDAGDRESRSHWIDLQIGRLMYGGSDLGVTLAPPEKAVLGCIRFHRGAEHAVSIRTIAFRTSLDARQIKNAVRTLRCNFHLPIGSSKHATKGGYFIILTPEDQAIFDGDFLGQIRAQVDAHRAVSGPHRTRELLGQLQMEIQ